MKITKILETLCAQEMIRKQAPIQLGIDLQKYLISEPNLAALKSSAQTLQTIYPDSVMRLFLHVLSLVKNGQVKPAYELVSQALLRNRQASNVAHAGITVSKKRAISLYKIRWILQSMLDKDAPQFPAVQTKSFHFDMPVENVDDTFSGLGRLDLESALFSRQIMTDEYTQSYYLQTCRRVFETSASLTEQLYVLTTILKGRPHQFETHHLDFKLARELYNSIRDKWLYLLGPLNKGGTSKPRDPLKTVSVLLKVLKVSKQLEAQDDIDLIFNAVMAMASAPYGKSVKWHAAQTLMQIDPVLYREDIDGLMLRAPAQPETSAELCAYLGWTITRGDYQLGITKYEQWPSQLRYDKCALLYAELLQCDGRFVEARDVKIAYNSAALSRAHTFCPAQVWSTYNQIEKLKKTIETNSRFLKTPQPKNPTGVIFIVDTDRLIGVDDLNVWKGHGWAVVSLKESVFTKQTTGTDALDGLHNCLSQKHGLLLNKPVPIGPLNDVHIDLNAGRLSWKNLDFSDVLAAYAGKKQRRYSIDFQDPILKKELRRVGDQVGAAVQLVSHIQAVTSALNLKAVILTDGHEGLPNLVYRDYCEKHGDPERFRCVQSQFVKLENNGKTLPLGPQAIVPNADSFEAYLDENKDDIAALLKRAKEKLNLTPPEGPDRHLHQDAKLTLLRIQNWKNNGGKVACVFGNITYHSDHFTSKAAVHTDIKDWINHTVKSVTGSDVLLLIKPHALEVRPDGAPRVMEQLRDFIHVPIPDNVIFLGHDWFEFSDLNGQIDLGLIYANREASIISAMLDLPCLEGSKTAVEGFPLGHISPKTLNEYSKYMRFEKAAKPKEQLSVRTAAWLDYTGYLNSEA